MVLISSGTNNSTPLGDFWLLKVEVDAIDNDTVNLEARFGAKAKEVLWASCIVNSDLVGTAAPAGVRWTSGTSTLTFANTGTIGADTGTAYASSGTKRRDVVVWAKSQAE